MKRGQFKSFVKAVNEADGTIEKIVSVFDNVDYVNDRVKAGAFKNSLAEWEGSGDPIPVIFSHQWENLDAHVGSVLEARELDPGDPLLPDEIKDNGGLYVKEKYDLDEPYAKKLFRLQQERRIKESSFAFDVVKEKRASDGVNDLLELVLIEVGPTLKGANPATQLLAIKARPKELRVAMSGKAEKKAWVELEGSIEEMQQKVRRAVKAWAQETWGDDLYWAGVEATFTERVVAVVELWETTDLFYFEIPYSLDSDGEVELGEERAVEIQGSITVKSRPTRESATKSADVPERVQSMHDLSVEFGADCKHTSPQKGDEDTSPAKGEDPAGDKPEELASMTPISVLLQVDEEALV